MPSKYRAPSKTLEPCQMPWSAARITATSPSCQRPSKKVRIFVPIAMRAPCRAGGVNHCTPPGSRGAPRGATLPTPPRPAGRRDRDAGGDHRRGCPSRRAASRPRRAVAVQLHAVAVGIAAGRRPRSRRGRRRRPAARRRRITRSTASAERGAVGEQEGRVVKPGVAAAAAGCRPCFPRCSGRCGGGSRRPTGRRPACRSAARRRSPARPE